MILILLGSVIGIDFLNKALSLHTTDQKGIQITLYNSNNVNARFNYADKVENPKLFLLKIQEWGFDDTMPQKDTKNVKDPATPNDSSATSTKSNLKKSFITSMNINKKNRTSMRNKMNDDSDNTLSLGNKTTGDSDSSSYDENVKTKNKSSLKKQNLFNMPGGGIFNAFDKMFFPRKLKEKSDLEYVNSSKNIARELQELDAKNPNEILTRKSNAFDNTKDTQDLDSRRFLLLENKNHLGSKKNKSKQKNKLKSQNAAPVKYYQIKQGDMYLARKDSKHPSVLFIADNKNINSRWQIEIDGPKITIHQDKYFLVAKDTSDSEGFYVHITPMNKYKKGSYNFTYDFYETK